MGAVYKREMRSYFTSPIGYVVAAVLFALYGFYYYSAKSFSSFMTSCQASVIVLRNVTSSA